MTVKEWTKARKWLKAEFENRGITRCEFWFIDHKCTNFALAFAHCKKRRKLLDGEIWPVAVACQTVHEILDLKMSHEEMEIAVHKAIDNHSGVIQPTEKKILRVDFNK